MRASCEKVTNQLGKLEERLATYSYCHPFNKLGVNVSAGHWAGIHREHSLQVHLGGALDKMHPSSREESQRKVGGTEARLSMHHFKTHSWREAMRGRWQSQQRTLSLPPHPHSQPSSKNTGTKPCVGAANQPVRPEAGKWEGNNLVRTTQVWRPQELSEAGSGNSSSAVMSTLPPPPPSRWPPLFVCAALLCPRGVLSLWFHSRSQCGWLLIGVMSWHGVGETTGLNFS